MGRCMFMHKSEIHTTPVALPSGFTRLAFITSTGTQCIDTGFKPNQDTRVVCDVDWAPASTASWLFGCRTSNTTETYNFLTYTNKYRSDYNATTSGAETSSTPSGRFIIDKDKNITKIDGVVVNTLTYASFHYKHNTMGTAADEWCRSVSDSTYSFCRVNTYGGAGGYEAFYSRGVAPGFCD